MDGWDEVGQPSEGDVAGWRLYIQADPPGAVVLASIT
jgi:hypothetical protein